MRCGLIWTISVCVLLKPDVCPWMPIHQINLLFHVWPRRNCRLTERMHQRLFWLMGHQHASLWFLQKSWVMKLLLYHLTLPFDPGTNRFRISGAWIVWPQQSLHFLFVISTASNTVCVLNIKYHTQQSSGLVQTSSTSVTNKDNFRQCLTFSEITKCNQKWDLLLYI